MYLAPTSAVAGAQALPRPQSLAITVPCHHSLLVLCVRSHNSPPALLACPQSLWKAVGGGRLKKLTPGWFKKMARTFLVLLKNAEG